MLYSIINMIYDIKMTLIVAFMYVLSLFYEKNNIKLIKLKLRNIHECKRSGKSMEKKRETCVIMLVSNF